MAGCQVRRVRSAALMVLAAGLIVACGAPNEPSTPASTIQSATSPEPAVATSLEQSVQPTATCTHECLPAGPFTTTSFSPMLTISVPDGWQVGEESVAEFKINLASDPSKELKFLAQPIPVDGIEGNQISGVETTPEGFILWLSSRDDLEVTTPTTRIIGRDIEALSVNVGVSESARTDDPGCPTERCAEFFAFIGPGYNFGYGMSSDQEVELLFAPVTVDGQQRTMLVIVDPGEPEQADSFATVIAPMLENLMVSTT